MVKILYCLLLAAVSSHSQPVTVPLIVEGNAPIVELSFPTPSGSLRKARFLVDTGGGAVLLGSKLMLDIGAKPSGPAVAEDGSRMVPLGSVTAQLGGIDLDFSGMWVGGIPASKSVGIRNDAEGLLPAKVFRHYDVVFDYPGRKFTLAKAGSVKPPGVKISAPISPDNCFPRIELQIGGATYGFLLDTGASFTMISKSVLDDWAKANPAWPTATGAIGFANMMGGAMENEALLLRIPKLKIGSLEIKDAAAVSRPPGTFEKWMSRMMTAPIVGALAGNVLRDFRVTIDYQNGLAYFERSGDSRDLDMVSVGLVLKTGLDGAPSITAVSSNASADVKTSVHVGDRLVAVDDVPLSGKPLAAAAEALAGRAGSNKHLTLERDGKPVSVTVTVASIL